MEELQRLAARHGGMDSGGDKKKTRQRAAGVRGWEGDELAHRLALQAMENYAKSLRVGIPIGSIRFKRDVLCSLLFFKISQV